MNLISYYALNTLIVLLWILGVILFIQSIGAIYWIREFEIDKKVRNIPDEVYKAGIRRERMKFILGLVFLPFIVLPFAIETIPAQSVFFDGHLRPIKVFPRTTVLTQTEFETLDARANLHSYRGFSKKTRRIIWASSAVAKIRWSEMWGYNYVICSALLRAPSSVEMELRRIKLSGKGLVRYNSVIHGLPLPSRSPSAKEAADKIFASCHAEYAREENAKKRELYRLSLDGSPPPKGINEDPVLERLAKCEQYIKNCASSKLAAMGYELVDFKLSLPVMPE